MNKSIAQQTLVVTGSASAYIYKYINKWNAGGDYAKLANPATNIYKKKLVAPLTVTSLFAFPQKITRI